MNETKEGLQSLGYNSMMVMIRELTNIYNSLAASERDREGRCIKEMNKIKKKIMKLVDLI